MISPAISFINIPIWNKKQQKTWGVTSSRISFLLQTFCRPIGNRHHSTGIVQRKFPFCHQPKEMVRLPLFLTHAYNDPSHNGDIFIKLTQVKNFS
jgi:hypothetical protein